MKFLKKFFKKKKQDMTETRFLKKIVSFCLIFIVLFTIVNLVFDFILHVELAPVLVSSVYTAFAGELAFSMIIKLGESFRRNDEEKKEKKKKRDENSPLPNSVPFNAPDAQSPDAHPMSEGNGPIPDIVLCPPNSLGGFATEISDVKEKVQETVQNFVSATTSEKSDS